MRGFWALLIAAVLALLPAPVTRAQTELDQTTRLAALARAWGLLKYFHPGVTSGTGDWDAALTGAIPRIKAASTKAAFNDELLRVVRAAGPEPRLPAGVNVEQPETEPLFAWLDDAAIFESPTMQALKTIRRATVPAPSRFVRRGSAGNPDFSGEAVWSGGQLPNEAERLLALFRFWNMVHYFFPNRDIMDRDWNEVLVTAIGGFVSASSALDYHLAAAELITNVNDSHAVIGSSTLSSHWGLNLPGIRTRFIESQTVVTRVFDRYIGDANVRVGDVITSVGGVPVADVRARIARYVASSNEGALQRAVDNLLLRTNASTLTLGLSRSGAGRSVSLQTYGGATIFQEENLLNSQQAKWQMLPRNVGYVNMGVLMPADVPALIAALRDTRAIVFDVRNYPNGTLYVLAQWLNPSARNFVTFTTPQYGRPGSFDWGPTLQAGPAAPRADYYRGRVLVLGDERTQSHAEFTMMALRTAPDVIVLGSPTAGADGNISQIDLPGGIRTYFSGIGVFYPDRTPTQRVGIVPDIFVAPTIAGIQNGVDEVLQKALTFVP
jgi:carboxyl-terminal processing protease